jgi:hypothetical protein
MGWPLTAVAALVTYLAIRAAQRALHEHDAAETTEASEASEISEASEAAASETDDSAQKPN